MPPLQIDIKQFEDQLAVLFPRLGQMYSWEIQKTLSNHILVELVVLRIEPSFTIPIVWSRSKAVWELDTWEKFVQLIEDEALSLADNLQDILDIFCLFDQAKRIIQNAVGLEQFSHNQQIALQAKYAEIIKPPACLLREAEQQARFWTVDLYSGDLEEWLFTQKTARLSIQSWVREQDFIISLEGLR